MKDRKRYLPFLLSALLVVLDQLTKAWIVASIPEGAIGWSFFSDFLWIVHVRNNAVAFSMGTGFPVALKYVLFVLVPSLLMGGIAWVIASEKSDREFSSFQKWCLSLTLGGGVGNLVDRIFRSLRVVDWISVRFYGLFGMERFPTWNVADAAVTVSVFLLVASMVICETKDRKERKNG